MKIGVGSQNKTKIEAVTTLIESYAVLRGAEVFGVDIVSEEFGHPRNLEETVRGAIDRAKQAYVGNDYGVGIEGGLLEVPHSKSGYMETAVCAIYDGSRIYLGMSPSFEWPTKVIAGIIDGLDGNQAMKASGFTGLEKIGSQGGAIGLLTEGRMNRTEQNRYAVMMALIQIEKPELFL